MKIEGLEESIREADNVVLGYLPATAKLGGEDLKTLHVN